MRRSGARASAGQRRHVAAIPPRAQRAITATIAASTEEGSALAAPGTWFRPLARGLIVCPFAVIDGRLPSASAVARLSAATAAGVPAAPEGVVAAPPLPPPPGMAPGP